MTKKYTDKGLISNVNVVNHGTYLWAQLLGLPYNVHTYMYLLSPIMGQLDLRSQMYIRNFRFLWHAFRSDNNITYTCINNALRNSNGGLGYKLAFV